MEDLTGTIINNRFRVDAFLGRGGMSELYKDRDEESADFMGM